MQTRSKLGLAGAALALAVLLAWAFAPVRSATTGSVSTGLEKVKARSLSSVD